MVFPTPLAPNNLTLELGIRSYRNNGAPWRGEVDMELILSLLTPVDTPETGKQEPSVVTMTQ